MIDEMIVEFSKEEATVIIEAETTTFYAYYLTKEEITGDVWLFNIGTTPDEAPWRKGGEPPFQNSAEYCYPHSITLPILGEEFRVPFNPNSKAEGIYFLGKQIGILKTDSLVAHKMDNPVPCRFELEKVTTNAKMNYRQAVFNFKALG